jgi:putative ABC transport system permease protein
MAEIDFDAARGFGGEPAVTGLADAGPTPRGDEAVVAAQLADDLRLSAGDSIEVHAYGQERSLRVRTVVPHEGLAGATGLFVAPGTLSALAAAAPAGVEPPLGAVLVSNEGGVYDGADRTHEVSRALDERLAGVPGVAVTTAKEDVLDSAAEAGASMRSLFSTVGTFSALVGVLLLVNLFVMLAEERTAELGTLRAIGLKRSHLVRLFGLEGGLYSLAAAGLGALLGVGVGLAVVTATRGVLAHDDGFSLVFSARPASLAAGALIGLAIALLTVWGTSVRIARLNVIRAIRELPAPPVTGLSRRRAVLASAGVAAGVAGFQAGLAGDQAGLVLGAPAVALFSAIPLLSRVVPRRLAVAGLALVAGAWAVVATSVVPAAFEHAGLGMFLVQGIVLVAAGVALASQADRLWARAADALAERGGLAGRLALAYPLARRGRTGILLAMFSLVVFTLTLMSAVSASDSGRAPQLAAEVGGGWDLWVDSSPTGPLAPAAIAATPGVGDVASLVTGTADVTAPGGGTPVDSQLTGFDAALLGPGTPDLADRLTRYGSDRAAVAAVAADPGLVLAPEDLATDGDSSGGGGPVEVGDTITVADPATGTARRLVVAGLVNDDWLGNGLLAARGAVVDILGDRAPQSRAYVAAAPGADPAAVADRLTADHPDAGADAHTFREMVDDSLREGRGFMHLLQGYLSLGLVIGIAGLGVVMARAVRERRRQVGMLRALGFPASLVRRAFLLEATFVATQGIAIGMALGLLTGHQIMTSDTFGDPVPFVVPWAELAVLVVVPALAAVGAAVVPAAQAARIRPAVALRATD